MAMFALTHAIKHVDYDEVFAVVERTPGHVIALALMLVAISYGSLTLYDLLALRTIGRTDVPYRIAALASFTSYPIAHGIGAVALVSPVIRYRIYSVSGLGAIDVANICFLTGLTFWLGNLTAFGFSVLLRPDAISPIDLPAAAAQPMAGGGAAAGRAGLPGLELAVAAEYRHAALAGAAAFRADGAAADRDRHLRSRRRGAGDVCADSGRDAHVEIFPVAVVFIVATLLGFASHAPAGIGVFDADDPDRAWRRRQGSADRGAADVPRCCIICFPSCSRSALFGARGRLARHCAPAAARPRLLHRRIELEPDHSGDDQRQAKDPNRIGRLAEDQACRR